MSTDPVRQLENASLLSEEYRRLNCELHIRDPNYGTTGRRYVDTIRILASRYQAQSILDYGCEKCDLWKALHAEYDVQNFDPAILEFATPPAPADLVACIDVLEHVEATFLTNVLRDLARVTIKIAFFTIATRPAAKHLADGTNCHRIVETGEWWQDQLTEYFQVAHAHCDSNGNGFQAIVVPRDARQNGVYYP